MKKFLGLFLFFLLSAACYGQNVTTASYDNNRSATTTVETILNPTNVSSGLFAKLNSKPLDGAPYGQPLVFNNVVFVATMADSVYAFNASDLAPIWQVNFTTSTESTFNSQDGNIVTGNYQVGILSTPVIDPATGTLYVVTLTNNFQVGQLIYRIHALDVTNGQDKTAPKVISGSVPGTGAGNVNGTIVFDANQHMQRPALTLAPDGTLIVQFGSWGDTGIYHGWTFAYDASTLTQTDIKCVTPNGFEGAIWTAHGSVIDSNNNLYVGASNGDNDGVNDFGESFIKYHIVNHQLIFQGFYSPYSDVGSGGDIDAFISGPTLLPGTNLLFGGGKRGYIYSVDTSTMAPHDPINVGGLYMPGAAWNGHIYVWPNRQFLLRYPYFNGALDSTNFVRGTVQAKTGSYSATLAISANGNTNGIVWAYMASSPNSFDYLPSPCTLYAFDAITLSELWNSGTNQTRDNCGVFAKFGAVPTVSNGRVYTVSLQDPVTNVALLNMYGLLTVPHPPTGLKATVQ